MDIIGFRDDGVYYSIGERYCHNDPDITRDPDNECRCKPGYLDNMDG